MAGVVLRTSAAVVKIDERAEGRVVVRSASPANVIVASVGRQGPPGPAGKDGKDGDGAGDPGDLTLYFLNALV